MLRLPRSLAVAMLLACVAMTAFGLASLVLPGSDLLDDRPNILDVLIFSTIFLSFPIVGLAVAWNRPSHPIGWLFLVIGLAIAMSVFSTEYASRAVFLGTPLPGVPFIAWMGGWSWFVAAGMALPLAITLFPTGRLPGPRWRPFIILGIVLVSIATLAAAIDPRPLTGYRDQVANPFGAGGQLGEFAIAIADGGAVALLGPPVLAVIALAVRFKRARGVERQQLKWLLFPAAIFAISLPAAAITNDGAFWTMGLFGIASFAVGVGIAILRHRLFDIDLVIRRTLVYGALVAVLGVVYVSLVVGLQAALAPLTGGDTLPVALSTLVIAALFGPVRARVRDLVDRRFYRLRYDAQRTVEAFAGQLRDEVETEAVGRTLIDAASRAVRPTAAAVWLRGGSPR